MYLVSYDIAEDRKRTKIAKELENFGKRVQYSVFECDIDQRKLNELYERLVNLMSDVEDGNIRIYSICRNCKEKLVTIGIAENNVKEDDVIVI